LKDLFEEYFLACGMKRGWTTFKGKRQQERELNFMRNAERNRERK
jgi:hypothetical protein